MELFESIGLKADPFTTSPNPDLFFPAKDYEGIFRIGVAISDKPQGPFTAMKNPIAHSFSIDPAVFKDDDGSYYMYFGGIWGGQLQRWRTGIFNANQPESPTAFLPDDDEPALLPLSLIHI